MTTDEKALKRSKPARVDFTCNGDSDVLVIKFFNGGEAGRDIPLEPKTMHGFGVIAALAWCEADGLPAIKGGIGAFIASFFESDAVEIDEPQHAPKDDAIEITEPRPEPQQPAAVILTIADFRTFLASHNGNRATLTRDDVFDWAEAAGLDVTDRDNRDKVSRWCRDEGIAL